MGHSIPVDHLEVDDRSGNDRCSPNKSWGSSRGEIIAQALSSNLSTGDCSGIEDDGILGQSTTADIGRKVMNGLQLMLCTSN